MRYLFLILPLVFMLACGESKPTEAKMENVVDPIEALKDEAIAVHDEVMPLMGPIDKLHKEINAASAQLVEAKLATAEEVEALSGRLHTANESMMEWMNDYSTQVVRKDGAASMETLEGLKKSVLAVRNDMKSAKTDAEALLAKLNQ